MRTSLMMLLAVTQLLAAEKDATRERNIANSTIYAVRIAAGLTVMGITIGNAIRTYNESDYAEYEKYWEDVKALKDKYGALTGRQILYALGEAPPKVTKPKYWSPFHTTNIIIGVTLLLPTRRLKVRNKVRPAEKLEKEKRFKEKRVEQAIKMIKRNHYKTEKEIERVLRFFDITKEDLDNAAW